MNKNHYINGLKFETPHPFRTEADRLTKQFYTDTIIENGIVRWKSNNAIPPRDILEFWNHLGYEFNYEASKTIGEKENAEILNNYIKNYKGPTEEQINEMQAAFGPGKTIINIITGQKYTT